MKPSMISNVLDLSLKIRRRGGTFNPLFSGPPGIAKSQCVQQWCKANKLRFIDLRAAYLEAPDLIGFPSIETKNGRQTTVHNTPDFWPTEGEGVILLEEPNRGTTSVMNTMMQMLTDHKVHLNELPPGWMFVACMNPDGEGNNDVNTMDPALRDRFVVYNVEYDKKSFAEYMKAKEWNKSLTLFVESQFQYKRPEEVGNISGAKYVSPRNLEVVNELMQNGVLSLGQEEQLLHFKTVLGNNVGGEFYSFLHDESPITLHLLKTEREKSLRKLNKFADPNNLKNGMISITLQDVLDNCKDGQDKIEDDLLIEVLMTIPKDHGVGFVRDLEYLTKDLKILDRLLSSYPKYKTELKLLTGK